ncbi:LysR family transcriptional regulator [Klebsiella variicola]|uniref:LysR family transcriptional regulator n=1 Tax=Klebsiella variicola TaxID=244366 RepID=UPI0009B9DCCF|nr:LysR family transcriptional regulator [Klebsiella variicola]SLW38120.1 LysR family transcriptional regulator [Klebsiella variicola]SLW49329.1 LysR family transcriptional regulator [Klebsiella variicola]
MKPTLNQLINFCTVAETGNIGKAASKLNISQPPLSRQIAQLETILGAKLFNRAAKGVSLTLAGEQFLLDCRAMLEQACNNVRAIESGQKGVLKLGATMYASYSVVPHVAMQHRNTCSDVELHFQERVPSDLHAALQDGRLDAAISFSETATPGIHSLVLLREPLIAALPANPPQVQHEHFRLESLCDDPFITVPRESAPMLYDSILHQCLKAGFSPQIGLEASVQQTVMNFVAHGVGVALIPASMENAQLRGVVYRKLENPNMVENMLMWSAKNTNPALPGFVNLCRSIKDKLDAAQAGQIND